MEAEAEAEAVNSQICLLEAEAVQKSTASASLDVRHGKSKRHEPPPYVYFQFPMPS